MDGTDIREQQEDPAGAPVVVAPEAASEPDQVTGTEPGAAVAVAAGSSANGTATGDANLDNATTSDSDVTSVATLDSDVTSVATSSGDDNDMGDVASLMEQFLNNPEHDYKTLKYGDVMDGIIMHIDRDELLVDIGSKAEGIIPSKEYSDLTSEERSALHIGDTILVFVVQPENPEGHPIVSINRARQEKSWRRLQEIHDNGDVIEAEVTNYNKGGLLVNLDGVRGFVPASQVTEIRGGDEASKQADMARLIGNSLPLKVIEINRHRNRLILSERQAIQERRDVMKERLISELKESEVRQGRVSSICDFGAFVDIGGADGLVHLSELSWSRVRHPSEILKIGQEVDVYVLGINSQEKKIALSIKRTQAEPWSRVATAYEVGQLVRGTVTQLANFGAFARIEDGIEGLIHVSELAGERITHPKQAVKEGQELLLRIIRIDPQRRRMGLSLRRALDTPDDELVGVFGEGAIEQRDRVIDEIRTSLAAEGIDFTLTPSEPATPPELAVVDRSADPDQTQVGAEGTGVMGSGTAVAPGAEVTEEMGTATPAPAASAMTDFQMPTERQQPRKRQDRDRDRDRRQERQSSDLDLGSEDMSAMAMAFAMAGAQADLDEAAAKAEAEAATAEVSAPSEPEASAAVEPEAAESEASAAAEPEAVESEASAAVEPEAAEPEAAESEASAAVELEAAESEASAAVELEAAESEASAAVEPEAAEPEAAASSEAEEGN